MQFLEKWDVVLVIVTLVGLFASVAGPMFKLIKAITKLTVTVESMEEKIADITSTNRESHKRLWEKNDEQDATISDHETRIGILEHHKDNARKRA